MLPICVQRNNKLLTQPLSFLKNRHQTISGIHGLHFVFEQIVCSYCITKSKKQSSDVLNPNPTVDT